MRIPTWWKDFKRLSYIDPIWLVIWVIIYITFISSDIFFPDFWGGTLIKYLGIFLCIIYAHQKYRRDYALQIALMFTLLADTLLVWTPFTLAGVYVFSFAQFMHLMRLTKLPNIALFYFAAGVSLFFGIDMITGVSPIYAIATIYGLLLITNLVISAKLYRKNNREFRTRCAFYGFVAFICCDFCVALRFIALSGALPPEIISTVSFLVWVFYYPSQVLLANSSTMKPSTQRKFAKSKQIR